MMIVDNQLMASIATKFSWKRMDLKGKAFNRNQPSFDCNLKNNESEIEKLKESEKKAKFPNERFLSAILSTSHYE